MVDIRVGTSASAVESSFEQTLIYVWRQTLVENAKVVVVGAERCPVRRTPKRRLRQVDFVFDGHEIRGLEHRPRDLARAYPNGRIVFNGTTAKVWASLLKEWRRSH